MDIPRIRIEVEGVRRQVQTMFANWDKEFSEIIQKEIEETLTQEWVMEQIKTEVVNAIHKAIRGISENWEIRKAIENVVNDAVLKIVESTEKK